jgi:hypothetical protein
MGMWRTLSAPPLGWQLFNAQSVADAQWQLRVARDPALVSPVLDMPMPRTIVIALRADRTRDGTAQLFVSDRINQFAESQSVRWQLNEGMHTYTIDLTTLASPPTRLVQLRLDPVAEGDNGTVTINGIWVP